MTMLQTPIPTEPLILVAERARTAYVAIPKCAMTSILQTWEPFQRLAPRPVHRRKWPHLTTRAGLLARSDLHRWCVVRDPRDRLVSLWEDKIREPREDITENPGLAEIAGASFPEFCRCVAGLPLGAPDIDRHLQLQWWFISVGHVSIVDQVFRMDDLPLVWPTLRQTYGFGPLPHSNRTEGRRPWESYYTPDLEALVHRVYLVDFERFGFSYTPPDTPDQPPPTAIVGDQEAAEAAKEE